MKRFFTSAFTLILLAAYASGQGGSTGRLLGTVSSSDGVIAGASITIRDNQTGKERTTTAGEDGTFSIPQLEAGTYTVTVAATGFKIFTANELKIDVSREYSLNPTLEVGSISETVTVTAGADILNATNAEISNTVSPRQTIDLPINGRDPLGLIQLQAGVASNGQTNTSINGQRPSATNITRDGINVQDQFLRGNATDFSPSRQTVDNISEFTVTTSNAGAEQGYGASQVQQVTPRGQNEFNGAIYAYNRNDYFGANEFFNNASGTSRPRLNRNQFGAKLSGPFVLPRFGEGGPALVRDRSFFFVNYEGLRLPVGSSRSRTILTPSARQGVFTYNRADNGQLQTVNLLDPRFGTGVTSIDPTIQSRLLSLLPAAGNAPGGDSRNTTGFIFNQAGDSERNQLSSRLDYDINDRHSINGIFSITRDNNLRPTGLTGQAANGFDPIPVASNRSDNELYVVAYRMTPSANFSNEIRGGYFESRVPFVRSIEPPPFFFGGLLFSNPDVTFLPQGRTSKNTNFQDNAQYQLGNHSLRFGGVAQFINVNSYASFSTVPTLTLGANIGTQITQAQFQDTTLFPGGVPTTQRGTANSLLALYGAFVTSVSQAFNATAAGFERGAPTVNEVAFENIGLYFSDQWRVTPRLTLNLGLRYELFTPLRDINRSQLEVVIPEGSDPVQALLNAEGRLDFVGTNAGGNRLFNLDKNNFAPNVSFAYSPQFKNRFLNSLLPDGGRTVIRGGYTIAYINDEYLRGGISGNEANPGLGVTTTLPNLVRTNLGNAPMIPLPTLTVPRTFAQSNALSSNNFAPIGGINPNIQVPFLQQYNFGIQREIGFDTAIEIRYVGNRSTNLTNQVDYNQVDIFRNGFFEDFQRARQNLFASRRELNRQIAANVPAAQRVAISGDFNRAVPGSQAFQGAFLNLGRRADLGGVLGGLNLGGIIADLDNDAPGQLSTRLVQNFLEGTTALRPNSNGGTLSLLDNISRSNYNSLQMEIRRRFSQGLFFQANYTFSKTLTDAQGLDQFRFEPRLDNNRPELEYGRGDIDQTHRFNFNSIYELPFGRGKKFLGDANGFVDRLLGGFQFNSIIELGSGAPVTITDTRGTFNRTTRSARQTPLSNLNGDELRNLFGVFERDGIKYFINPDVIDPVTGRGALGFDLLTGQELTFPGQVFFNVPGGQVGNVPRAIGTGPIYFNVNASLLKNIRITEGSRLQLRAEAFNLFNRANFAAPDLVQDISSSSFGRISDTFSPRIIQFAARFEF